MAWSCVSYFTFSSFLPTKICSCKATYNEFFLFYPASSTVYSLKRSAYLCFICPHLPASPWCQTQFKEALPLALYPFCSRQRILGFAPQDVASLEKLNLGCTASGEFLVSSHALVCFFISFSWLSSLFCCEAKYSL